MRASLAEKRCLRAGGTTTNGGTAGGQGGESLHPLLTLHIPGGSRFMPLRSLLHSN